MFLDKTLDLHRYGDSNTPYQGTLTVNGVRYSVIYNSTNSVFINTPDLIPPLVGSQFVLDDDDDFNQNDAVLRSDEGEALTGLADTFSLMQMSDDPLKNVYAAAYIMPVYDGGGAPIIRTIFHLLMATGLAGLIYESVQLHTKLVIKWD